MSAEHRAAFARDMVDLFEERCRGYGTNVDVGHVLRGVLGLVRKHRVRIDANFATLVRTARPETGTSNKLLSVFVFVSLTKLHALSFLRRSSTACASRAWPGPFVRATTSWTRPSRFCKATANCFIARMARPSATRVDPSSSRCGCPSCTSRRTGRTGPFFDARSAGTRTEPDRKGSSSKFPAERNGHARYEVPCLPATNAMSY
jgi:hypothetical protein